MHKDLKMRNQRASLRNSKPISLDEALVLYWPFCPFCGKTVGDDSGKGKVCKFLKDRKRCFHLTLFQMGFSQCLHRRVI